MRLLIITPLLFAAANKNQDNLSTTTIMNILHSVGAKAITDMMKLSGDDQIITLETHFRGNAPFVFCAKKDESLTWTSLLRRIKAPTSITDILEGNTDGKKTLCFQVTYKDKIEIYELTQYVLSPLWHGTVKDGSTRKFVQCRIDETTIEE